MFSKNTLVIIYNAMVIRGQYVKGGQHKPYGSPPYGTLRWNAYIINNTSY